ncbi:MAG: hypothetical protein K4571_01460 [Deltaproteobacteria bacterium]
MKAKMILPGCLRIVLLLLILTLFSCSSSDAPAPLTLAEQLKMLCGNNVTEIAPPSGFQQAFQIDIAQPVDHNDPGRGMFQQRFYLSFRSKDAPTVFYTTGYGVGRNFVTEPAHLLKANQVLLVHRYFSNAVPSTTDWSFLTTAQAAADQHRIRTLLGVLLHGKWVSSGASKGGMTALYYRYYYPDDVAATIAYVAPIMERTEDERFITFLNQVGTPACREKLRLFQREVLTRRQAMLVLTHNLILQEHLTFTLFSEAEALEYSVLDHFFTFWQYGAESNCATIPSITATDEVLFNHLDSVVSPSYYSDADVVSSSPLYYQAYTEIGYYPFMYDHLTDLLQSVPAPTWRPFAPRNVELIFRPEVMQQIVPWLRHHGERILYIYGGIDPWSAAALNPDPGIDALQIVQPGGNHMTEIATLGQKDLVIRTLERWLDMNIDAANQQPSAVRVGKHRL